MIQDVWISAGYYVITLMVENVGRLFVEEVKSKDSEIYSLRFPTFDRVRLDMKEE